MTSADRVSKASADPAERRAIVASVRGALSEGPSLTVALEAERHVEREHEDLEDDGSNAHPHAEPSP
jgi:hypothetical protein